MHSGGRGPLLERPSKFIGFALAAKRPGRVGEVLSGGSAWCASSRVERRAGALERGRVGRHGAGRRLTGRTNSPTHVHILHFAPSQRARRGAIDAEPHSQVMRPICLGRRRRADALPVTPLAPPADRWSKSRCHDSLLQAGRNPPSPPLDGLREGASTALPRLPPVGNPPTRPSPEGPHHHAPGGRASGQAQKNSRSLLVGRERLNLAVSGATLFGYCPR